MSEKEKKRPVDSNDETIKRVGGYLHRIVPIVDETGKVIQHVLKPFMVEFRPRDLMQVLVGASILAVPVAFTEETWKLGAELPIGNVILLSAISILIIALYVYLNFYRFHMKDHVLEYLKRISAIYFFSLLVVAILLTLIGRCPWNTDIVVALKRILIVAFPASMSAALSDTLK